MTPKICFGEISTTVTATRGQDGYPVTSTGTNVHGEEEWDDEFDAGVGSSDSSEEENNQEMALLREEVRAMFNLIEIFEMTAALGIVESLTICPKIM